MDGWSRRTTVSSALLLGVRVIMIISFTELLKVRVHGLTPPGSALCLPVGLSLSQVAGSCDTDQRHSSVSDLSVRWRPLVTKGADASVTTGSLSVPGQGSRFILTGLQTCVLTHQLTRFRLRFHRIL